MSRELAASAAVDVVMQAPSLRSHSAPATGRLAAAARGRASFTLVTHPRISGPSTRWLAWKRVIDIAGSLLLLLALSPLMLAAAMLIACTGGKVLFRQQRIGQRGRMFHLYKFRTMRQDAAGILERLLAADPVLRDEWHRTQKLQQDPRITPIGRILRKFSIDELPQLFNVLRGEMSLVGPRPVLLDELPRYGRASLRYLAVRPGITGLWQVSGRTETTYRRRVALDSHYVRRQSLWLDLAILLRTPFAVLSARGAK
ncbi:MAG TPA: sugar transferase [Solimonas sp.]|nr:sugar transferase [Solimonas sp.]